MGTTEYLTKQILPLFRHLLEVFLKNLHGKRKDVPYPKQSCF